jgi:hypothetical protein
MLMPPGDPLISASAPVACTAYPPPPADDERYVGVGPALRAYMRHVHAPLLRRPAVKAGVLALFGGVFLLSCALLPRLDRCARAGCRGVPAPQTLPLGGKPLPPFLLGGARHLAAHTAAACRGLDQSVALPRDSYLQPYYADVMRLLRWGDGRRARGAGKEQRGGSSCTRAAEATPWWQQPRTNRACAAGAGGNNPCAPRQLLPQPCPPPPLPARRVGPPVMFVVQDLNVSAAAPDVAAVCSVAGCDADSLLNQVWLGVQGAILALLLPWHPPHCGPLSRRCTSAGPDSSPPKKHTTSRACPCAAAGCPGSARAVGVLAGHPRRLLA